MLIHLIWHQNLSWISLKAKREEKGVEKLKSVAFDLCKFRNVVKTDAVKGTAYDEVV